MFQLLPFILSQYLQCVRPACPLNGPADEFPQTGGITRNEKEKKSLEDLLEVAGGSFDEFSRRKEKHVSKQFGVLRPVNHDGYVRAKRKARV